jgi:RND family efflux transporter MFP subunit
VSRTALVAALVALAALAALAAGGERGHVGVIVSGRVVDVTPRIEGRLESVAVRLGDAVDEGQLLARLEARSARAEHAMVRAALAAAEAEARRAGVEARAAGEREQRLEAAAGIVSREDLDDARLRAEMAAAALEAALARVAEARARAAQLTELAGTVEVRAAFAGIVARRYLEAGSRVDPATPIVRLLDPRQVWVRFAVSEAAARRLEPGSPIDVVPAGRAADEPSWQRVGGTVERIAPEIDAAAQLVLVEARLEDGGALPLGLEVRVLTSDMRAEKHQGGDRDAR